MSPEEIADLWVRGDPALESDEKETTIRWAKPDDAAVVHTDERGPGRRLIKHPDSTVEEVSVLRDGGDTYDALEPEEVREDDEVVGVRVRLPVAALKVQRTARDSSQHAEVVSEKAYADGGRYILPAVGDRVRDRERDEEVVVVGINPDERAADRRVPELSTSEGTPTVADVNAEYDPDAPVVEAVYTGEDGVTLAEWRSTEAIRRAAQRGEVTIYTFPADRLGPVEEAAQ